MNLFLDTEFWERGDILEPISIGLVTENGFSFYAENAEFDWTRSEIPEWLHKNVKRHLKPKTCSHVRAMIGENMRHYLEEVKSQRVDNRNTIDVWAYYGASDWTIFRNLLGGFWSIPEGYTKWHRELAEIAEIRPKKSSTTQHNALSDAMWNWSVWTINTQGRLA